MNLLVFCIPMLSMSVNAVAAPVFRLFRGEFDPPSVSRILESHHCRLPDADQLKRWHVNGGGPSAAPGLYWVKPPHGTVGFAQYLYLPTLDDRDFGGRVFAAKLLAIC